MNTAAIETLIVDIAKRARTASLQLATLETEIKNKFLNMIMSKSFEFGLNKIADAFQKKAENL